MPEVPNLKNYIRKAMTTGNPGEGSVEGGLSASVDILNIGAEQIMQFHKNGSSLEEVMAEKQPALMARITELMSALPPEEQSDGDAVKVVYNQAINEVLGTSVFSLQVLIQLQAVKLDKLAVRVSQIENPVTNL